MPDLERALRDLLTDEHLRLPVRPDAARIVRDGVRRRRRRRVIAISTAAAATTGAIVAAAFVVPAALQAGGTHKTTPVQPNLSYDVAWIDKPAPKPWSPKPIQPKPPTMDAPRCTATQLRVGTPTNNGATGMYFTTIPLRNISTTPCLLVGTPVRVAAQSPGQPDVVATRGLHLGSGGVGGDLQPGRRGYLTIETDRDCPARYATPNVYPHNIYNSLSVTLPSATTLSLPLKLDVECGLYTGGLGIRVPPPTTPPDPRATLQPSITSPKHAKPGATFTYVVTLSNPTDSAISLGHCPGYVEWMGSGDLELAKESLALDCATVRSIAPGQSVRYQMRMAIAGDATPGVLELTWSLEAGLAPEASTTVVITPA
jgi:hypothetical protein